jgi:hypothetical protein|tara:strand:+ start:4177 stop:5580 length:1404 start_codon:yes stop_codon:yes gene_type:complete
MAKLNLRPVPMQEGGLLNGIRADTTQPVTLEQRNAPIIDIIGSQAAAPVLPAGATFVGEGQTAQPLEFQQTPQITDAPAVSTPSIAQAPATQITPTTAPTIETAQRAAPAGVMDAATLAAPTQVIDAPQRGVSEQAIPVAAVQDLQEQATVQYQLSELYKSIEDGKPLPAWASGAARGASQVMQQRGLGSSSMAAAAIAQSVLESAIPIAAADAQSYKQIQLQNLSNQQQAALAKAATFAQMDTENLNARLTSAVNNARNFLTIDTQNLSNQQNSNTISYQAKIQELFTDQAQENATRQLNAKNQIQVEEFFAQLGVQVDEANANRSVAIDQFNVGQERAVEEFNTKIQDSRDKFNATMTAQIDASNALWRRTVNTRNTALQNEVNRVNAQTLLGLSTAAQNQLWQQYRDEAAWLVGTTEAKLDRAHQFALLSQRADLAADASYANSFGQALGAVGQFALESIFGLG